MAKPKIKNYAVVDEDNNVVNVIAWDGVTEYNPGKGLTLVQSDTAGKGHTYDPDTEEFEAPIEDDVQE